MRSRLGVPLLALALAAGGAVPAAAQDGTASLSGTVTSAATGQPLAGVCVEVQSETVSRSATTAADGTWRATGLPAGEHVITFNVCAEPLAGFAGEFYEDAASWADADPVVLRAGQQRTGVDAALEAAARISGRLTDDTTGQPLEGICVIAFDDQLGSFGQDRSAADGTYALESLRGGTYTVIFQDCSDPYTHLSEAYDDVPLEQFSTGQEPTPVVVEDAQTRTGVDAGLQEGGSVAGTVVGQHHGQPLSNVCVALVQDGAQEPEAVTFSGYTPDFEAGPVPGGLVFPGVRPGSYGVLVNPLDLCGDDGYLTAPVTGGDDVLVVKGRVTQLGELVLTPSPSISYVCPSDPTGPDGPPPFSDVRNTHAAAIECIASYGITTGRADGTYGPAEVVQRGQMASFLARTLTLTGVELPASPPDAFGDDEGSPHERAIDQLAALGVLQGKAPGRFAPGDGVSRAQTATLLVRAYEEATGFALRRVRDAFLDDDGNTHEERIDKAAAAGLAAGEAGRFSPGADVRRDQMATFLARMLDRVQRDRSATAVPGEPMPAPATAPAEDGTTASRWSPSAVRSMALSAG